MSFAESLTQKDYEQVYAECMKEHGNINNSVVMTCSHNTSMEAKAEMTELYNQIYHNLKDENLKDAKKLEDTQKSWIKYRDSHCELSGSYVGSPMYEYCPMELNVQRVHQLRELNGE